IGTYDYQLNSDIDLGGSSNLNIPYFTGTLEGHNYTINNLTFLNSQNPNCALFGYVSNAEFSNISLDFVAIEGARECASLALKAYDSSFTNCHSNGVISGEMAVGGLIGNGNRITVTNCSNSADVTSLYGICGGLAMVARDVTITNSHNSGNISGNTGVGGLFGITSYTTTMSNCYNTGIICGDTEVGGLIGSNGDSGEIQYCYNTGDVTANQYAVGGLFGNSSSNADFCYNTGNVTGDSQVGGLSGSVSGESVTNCYNTGNVTGNSSVAGLFNNSYYGIQNCHYDYETVLINGGEDISFGALPHDMYEAWMNNGFTLNIDSYLTGQNNIYQISSGDDLEKLLYFGQFDYDFILTNDLDMNNYSSLYIPYFKGSFNGDGFSVLNFNLDSETDRLLGFFGRCSDAEISNLNIIDAHIGSNTAISTIGGLSGEIVNSTVNNCRVSGVFIGSNSAGLVASATSTTITNSATSGMCQGWACASGFAMSLVNVEVSNCYSDVSIIGNNSIGGFSLYLFFSDITNCYFSGSIDWQDFFGNGEVFGFTDVEDNSSTIDACFWNTETSGITTSTSGTGITTLEMQDMGTFLAAGWDFVGETANGTDNYWDMTPGYNNGFPFLSVSSPTGIDEDIVPDVIIPTRLIGNYPNPFNPETTIKFSISKSSNVDLSIYNIKGQRVRTLTNQQYQQGEHSIVWEGADDNGRSVSSGVYFYKLGVDGSYTSTKKCILMK
ncbi:MAG: T9SS type A sorting domain-containing protein, partial [Candidatus Cloacimonetes bacterium]|nr:T9SS type A sorting domain-containing protein [Candidatus Cloacimonadota bacterium]